MRVIVLEGVWIEKIIIWDFRNISETFFNLSLTALSNFPGLVDATCLIKFDYKGTWTYGSLSHRYLTSFKISWQLTKALYQQSCLRCLQILLSSPPPANSHPPLKKQLSHCTLSWHCIMQTSLLASMAPWKLKYLSISTHKIITICINKFSISLQILFIHLWVKISKHST